MKRIFFLLAILIIIAGCTDTDPIVVDTFRGNPISGTQSGTLTAAGGPYLATADVTVPAGQEWVIQAGTELRFEPGVSLYVFGKITAIGSEIAPITFTSGARNPARGDWDGVWLVTADPGSKFEYCRFLFGSKFGRRYSYDSTGTELDSTRIEYGCLTLQNSSPSIKRSWFLVSGYHGLHCDPGSNPTVENCIFYDNAGNGIYIDANANPTINYSIISENDDYGIFFAMPGEAVRDDAEFNYNIIIENFSGEFNRQAPLRLGRIAGANGNLDSCDYRFNLRLDPEFIGASKIKNGVSWDFHLNPWSPAIDAGPVSGIPGLGHIRLDLGVYPYKYRPGEIRRLFTEGTLTTAGSPYILSSNIYLPAGQSLQIQPGVEIRVEGRFQISLKGRILASGQPTNPIKIYSAASAPAKGDWVGLIFESGGDPGSVLSYTEISHARWGVKMSARYLKIDHCVIANSDSVGIYCDDISNPEIEACRIENNSIAGILCRFNSSPTISGNFISGSTGYGIHADGSSRPVIENNVICYNETNGVRLDNLSNAVIRNNVFANNGYFGLFCSNNSSPDVRNNIFYRNGSVLRGGMGVYAVNSSFPVIAYNDFLGNAVAEVSISSNTTLSDSVTNLRADPMFVDEAVRNYLLKVGSPCIDRGDPALSDPNGGRSDIGIYNKPYVW